MTLIRLEGLVSVAVLGWEQPKKMAWLLNFGKWVKWFSVVPTGIEPVSRV